MQQELIKNLIEYIESHADHGATWTSVAKAMGLSVSTLTQFRDEKYVGNVERIASKIDRFLKMEEERRTGPQGIPFAATRNARTVMTMCDYAVTFGAMAMVTGRAGFGKTYALKEFARQNPNTHYILVNQTFSFTVVLKRMCKALGLSPEGSSSEMYDRLVEKLAGSDRLFIFDEAQEFNFRSFEIVRNIYDETGIGIVLAGDHRLYERIQGIGSRMRTDRNFDQLYSRIKQHQVLKPFSAKDVGLILHSIFGEVPDEVVAYAAAEVRGSGRNLENVIENMQIRGIDEFSKKEFDVAREYAVLAA